MLCQCVNKYLQEELKTTANKLLQKRQHQLTVNTIINGRGKNGWMFKVFTATDPIQSIVPYLQYTTRVLLMITFARGSRWKWSTVLFSAGEHFQTLDCDISILWCHSYLAFRLLFISFYTNHLYLLKKDAICDVMVLLSTYQFDSLFSWEDWI